MSNSVPTISASSFVTLHYRLSGPKGDVVNTFLELPATLTLGVGQLSPALEQCLIGLPQGARQQFEVAEGLAFGPRNPEMLQWVTLQMLHRMGDPLERYEEGDVVTFPTPDGQGSYAGVVRERRMDEVNTNKVAAVLFDFNHPLAGQPVQFEVQIIGILD